MHNIKDMESSADLFSERQNMEWSTMDKHSSSVETDVLYPISHFIFEVAKFEKGSTHKNGKKILNLSYGEPTRENGFFIP